MNPTSRREVAMAACPRFTLIIPAVGLLLLLAAPGRAQAPSNPPSVAAPTSLTIKVDLGLGDLARASWDIWRSASADAKTAVPASELIQKMSTLVGLREAFLPRFAEYVNVDRASSAEVARLRSQAGEILNVARDLDTMVKKLDPTFASAHSEVQIESVRVATERAFQSEATVRVFD